MTAINIKRAIPAARLPAFATPGSACFDFFTHERCILRPDSTAVFDTGLIFELPEYHVMLLFGRSGHGFHANVRLANCVGVIDADYRDTVKIKLTADSTSDGLVINPGDRIAQGLVLPYPPVYFIETETVSQTERPGGLGSTGA
jgi:dUTP pyrophosphatase